MIANTWKIDYLNNHTCYDQIICTILFSSRWRVCWNIFLSVLSTLRKWQKFNETSNIRGFCQFRVIFYKMRYWYHYNVQLISSEMVWLVLLYCIRLQSYSFVEITKVQAKFCEDNHSLFHLGDKRVILPLRAWHCPFISSSSFLGHPYDAALPFLSNISFSTQTSPQ